MSLENQACAVGKTAFSRLGRCDSTIGHCKPSGGTEDDPVTNLRSIGRDRSVSSPKEKTMYNLINDVQNVYRSNYDCGNSSIKLTLGNEHFEVVEGSCMLFAFRMI